ncbi:MAG: hypothetical protein ACREHG_03545 [Candidatus Saccharimonadales bacterium]
MAHPISKVPDENIVVALSAITFLLEDILSPSVTAGELEAKIDSLKSGIVAIKPG